MQRAYAWRNRLGNVLVGAAVACGLCYALPATWSENAGAAPASNSEPGDELQKAATWQWRDIAIIEQHFLSYLDQVQAPADVRGQVLEHWKKTSAQDKGPAFLERVLSTAALVEPRIAELVEQLNDPQAAPVVPKQLSWLASDVPGWLQDSIRLACGRALAQRRLYDEALEAMSGLEIEQVCDPASLIFYRAVCQHHLLQKKECLANVELLLERQDELPARFTQVSQLMAADIQPLKDDSLDEVARLMNDVQRRLDLGRAGKRVRDEEDAIVDKLDKMIDQIEQQLQQQQQQQQAGGQQGQQPQGMAQPMEDSQIAGGSGPGDVDQKDIGKRDGWGNLPPAERQAALQRMTQELPSHYREVIEGYFRQLSKEKK
jgi:hypothetical protein